MRVEKTDEYREWIDSLKDLAGRARIPDALIDLFMAIPARIAT